MLALVFAALLRFMLHRNRFGTATLTATYAR